MSKKFSLGKFFKETYNRLFTGESPYYFTLIRKIVFIGGILIGVPAAIVAFNLQYQIDIPAWLVSWGKVCFTIGAVLSYVGNIAQTYLFKKDVTAKKMPLTEPSKPFFDD